MSSFNNYAAPAQREPAWKRLGLKLKKPGNDSPASSASPASPSSTPLSTSGNKRKEPPSSSLVSSASFSKRRKSVSFANDSPAPQTAQKSGTAAAEAAVDTPSAPKEPKRPKREKKKKAPKKVEEKAAPNLQREIEYLQQWKDARGSWKFNKNHQNLLIKYIFAGRHCIPSSHIDIFYDYIRDLQGGVRTRLRDEAVEICKLDKAPPTTETPVQDQQSDKGKGKGEGKEKVASDAPVAAEEAATNPATDAAPEVDYASIVADVVPVTSGDSEHRERISEVDCVAGLADSALRARLVRRIRAENVVSELADANSGGSGNGSGSAPNFAAVGQQREKPEDSVDDVADKQVKLNDKPSVEKKRGRKSRTMVGSDSDSSDSDSDSDSDSSSSSSGGSDSSDDDSDEEAVGKSGSKSRTSSSSSSKQ